MLARVSMSEAVEGAELMLYGVSEKYKERSARPRWLSSVVLRLHIVVKSRVSLAVVSGPLCVGIVLTSRPCVSQRQLPFGAQLVSLTTRRRVRILRF